MPQHQKSSLPYFDILNPGNVLFWGLASSWEPAHELNEETSTGLSWLEAGQIKGKADCTIRPLVVLFQAPHIWLLLESWRCQKKKLAIVTCIKKVQHKLFTWEVLFAKFNLHSPLLFLGLYLLYFYLMKMIPWLLKGNYPFLRGWTKVL